MAYIPRSKWAETLAEVRHALRMGADKSEYDAVVRKFSEPVTVEFPLGEVAGGNLAGFAWAWKMKGKLQYPLDITGKEAFCAQGLEGKAAVEMSLYDAMIVASQTDACRIAIKKGR